MTNFDLIFTLIVKSFIFIAFWCLYFALVILAFNHGRFKELVNHRFSKRVRNFEQFHKSAPVEHSNKK